MNALIHAFASMKVAVILLAVIVVALATGTFVESSRGAPAALSLVYGAVWFRALLALFAMNVACSLYDTWPWAWRRLGYVITHGSMLVILAGALVTDRFKIEGHLDLWEGEESRTFTRTMGSAVQPWQLPFTVRLDAFEVDYYQGTRRPAMYRSRVTVTDPATGRWRPAVIQMNQELSRAGWKLFQSSYNQTPDRDQTILSVSRDPGQPIVFAGYALLMIGMTVVFVTRMVQARQAAVKLERGRLRMAGVRRKAGVAAALALAILPFSAFSPAQAASLPAESEARALSALPVQHDGRVMPLDTLARETVWKVTGERAWQGIDPTATVLGWSLDPQGWLQEKMIAVHPTVARNAGMPEGVGHVSFREMVDNMAFMGQLDQLHAYVERDMPLTPFLRKVQDTEERLVIVQSFIEKRAILPVPPDGVTAAGAAGAWGPPVSFESAADLRRILESGVGTKGASPRSIQREITYNQVAPSRLSWWILAAATVASFVAWRRPTRWLGVLALAGLFGGFGTMTWGLAARWSVAGRIPASNMYESMLFLGWGVGLFALLALLFLRNRLVVFNAAAMSALTMALCDLLPIDPFIHPMPPVLSGTPWLAIHVPIIMVSYSVLALGVLIAHMQLGVRLFSPGRTDLADRMNDLLYWYLHAGSILLIAGILTGSIWAASSWGRYWGWDPKEVWSLIAFLAYLAILHGRFDNLFGPGTVAALSIVAFWTILMTYVGVNFVLSSGLHSYGFGSSAVVLWMGIVAGAEVLFLAAALMRSRASWRHAAA